MRPFRMTYTFVARTMDKNTCRMLVENAADYAAYMLSPDGRVLVWNGGAERFTGFSAPEVIGSHFDRFFTQADRDAGLPAMALDQALAEGHYESEGWRLRKDGSTFWAHALIDAVMADNASLTGFISITRDISVRREGDETLRRNERQFQILVDGVADYAIYLVDPTGHVSSWNSGAERIKGFHRDEIVGTHFSHFYTPEDRAAGVPERNLSVAAETGRLEAEGWRIRKDGSRFWAHVILDRVTDDDGRLIGFAKVTRDVTDQRDAARQLEEAREALFQSQKMEAIGQLTGGMAHDFNNLLMAIQGALELLHRRLPDDTQTQTIFNTAMAGVSRGAGLTQRMLAFARRQQLRPVPVDFVGLVHGMSSLLQSTVGSRISMSSRLPIALDRILVDPNQLELALLNLVVNARDALPNGGAIDIAARAEAIGPGHRTGLAPGRYICLTVADDGQGMDPDTLARAADPFFTTKGAGKGTGLGLSMVHGLAAQSQGRLMLHSEAGKGTQAEIWLPAVKAADQPGESTQVPDRQKHLQAPAALPALRILAVDDDTLVRVTMCAQLEEMGHIVTPAASGEQAMEAFGMGEGFDLLVTDYAMPGMTGSDLARAIWAMCPEFPVVLATGFAELPLDETAVVRLSKPYDRHELTEALQKAAPTLTAPTRH
jgi:PAS domain S-box-containing protein